MMTASAIKDSIYEKLCMKEQADIIVQLRPTSVFTISAGQLTDSFVECETASQFIEYVRDSVIRILKEKHEAWGIDVEDIYRLNYYLMACLKCMSYHPIMKIQLLRLIL